MNLPTTFDPIAYTGEVEKAARAASWTVRYLSPMESGPRPWFQRAAADGDSAPPRLYLSAGIHGDEISGPLSLLEMIRQPGFFAAFDVTMFPILNPDGLARGVRTNRDGIDLNRDYRNSRSLEIKGHSSPNWARLKTVPSGPRRFISRSITLTWSTQSRRRSLFQSRHASRRISRRSRR